MALKERGAQSMENLRSSIEFVAPLHIVKTQQKTSKATTFKSTADTWNYQPVSLNNQAPPSPPQTPKEQNQDYAMTEHQEEGVFPNFLRATHHFQPVPTDADGTDTSVTVAVNAGEIILVHSIHSNGWADGTILPSGARGWLPTNYCEPFSDASIENILSSLTYLWDLVQCVGRGDFTAFRGEDYVKRMIAGVRYFLQRIGCLNKSSSVLETHVALRRCRKSLLRVLSSFVKASKQLQGLLLHEGEDAIILGVLDEVVNRAFKVVNRAVKLNDILNYLNDSSSTIFSPETRLPTPPMEAHGSSNISVPSTTTRITSASNSLSDGEFSTSNYGFKIFNYSRTVPSTGRAQSALATSTGSLHLPQFPNRPHSYQQQGSSVWYRVSYNHGQPDQRKNILVSEQLFSAHDTFLGCIGAFIGLHLHSRSSSELHTHTERSVKACQTLLSLIDDLWERDLRRSQDLLESREALRSKVSDLVCATKEVFSKDPADGEQLLITDEGKQIVSAATNCVRSAAECVAKAKFIVERIGDYELEVSKIAPFEDNDEREKREDNQLKKLSSQENRASIRSNRSKEVANFSRTSIKIRNTPQLSPTTSESAAKIGQATTPQYSSVTQAETPLPSDPSELSSSSSSPMWINAVAAISSITGTEEPKISDNNPLSSPRRISETQDEITVSTRSDGESAHDVHSSGLSFSSTRATSPDSKHVNVRVDDPLAFSFSSASDFQSFKTDNSSDLEDQFPGKSYYHELAFSKDGQIVGGTLPALVEQLTTHDSTPDATFVNAFYLTFRLFTSPMDFIKALIDRYDYIGDYPTFATPVRLRVYNVMKGWLESHWNSETDSLILNTVKNFADEKLCKMWPAAASRLDELTSRLATALPGSIVLRCPTAMGKRTLESGNSHANDNSVPNPVISRTQLGVLRNFRNNGAACSILAFDPLELARQFTIIESRIFCSIQPEELLALEWTKKTDSKATNVRAMSTLSTDLANLVADTILQPTEAKRRAIVIKQWVKIAMRCLDLNNYDSLMAIICSLNSSMILRLKRTWDAVSAKTKNRLEELRSVVDVGRNYAVLRQRLQNHVAPCIPFVGIYLTDLTFVDVGNQTTRQLPGQSGAGVSESAEGVKKEGSSGVEVINFDKYMRTAKIIGQLQRFQIPHRLAPVPEMQEWMDYQIMRVRSSEQANVQGYYRRSLLLEPREPAPLSNQSQEHNQPKNNTSPTLTSAPVTVSPTVGNSTAIDSTAIAIAPSASLKDGSRLERFGLHFLSSNASKEKAGS